ncbi:MAG: transposase [Nitrospirota bacterium]
MARPLRLQYPGALYHITARGNERKPIFRDEADREMFLSILSHAVERYRLRLHAYVLMDNHYHLLVETPEPNLARALRHLNGVYTGYFNRTHRRVGHLFQGRYKAILVEKDSYLLELSRYLHLNPVRVRRPALLARYPWSSYWDYIGKRRAPQWLTQEDVLGAFGGGGRRAQRAYQAFVEDGMTQGRERPWEQVIGQVVLGGEGFLRSIQKRISGSPHHREIPSLRQLAVRPSLEQIQEKVRKVSAELAALRTGNRSNPGRAILLYVAREHGGLSLKELAACCGLEESTISQTVGRVAQLRRSHPAWDRLLWRLERDLIHNP